MALKEFFMGSGPKIAQVPNQMQRTPIYNKNQEAILNYLLSRGKAGLEDPYAGFQPIAQQARTQFEQQTVPGIAERFTSMGSNALSSPSFASQLGQSGAGLEQMLAAMQAQYGQQSQDRALQQLGYGLNPRSQFSPQYQNYPQEGQGGFLSSLLPALLQTGGTLLGGMFGGPAGAVAGGAAGSGLSSLFGGGQNKLGQQFGLSDDYFNLGQRDFTGQKQYYANPGSSGTDYGRQFGLNSGYLNL